MNTFRISICTTLAIGLMITTILSTPAKALGPAQLDRQEVVPQYPPTNVISGYPQPFNTVLHVQVKGYDGKPIVIELRQTMNGSPVLQQAVTYNGTVHLNTASLPTGWYILAATFQGRVIGMREVQKGYVR